MIKGTGREYDRKQYHGRDETDRPGHQKRDGIRFHRLFDVCYHSARAARCARRPEAGAPAHPIYDARARQRPLASHQKIGRYRRRGAGLVPPARRRLCLRRDGAPGTGFFAALSAGGRAGQLWFRRRGPARRLPLHRGAHEPPFGGSDARYRKKYRRFYAELR